MVMKYPEIIRVLYFKVPEISNIQPTQTNLSKKSRVVRFIRDRANTKTADICTYNTVENKKKNLKNELDRCTTRIKCQDKKIIPDAK